MIEISYCENGQLIWNKEFKTYKEHIEIIKNNVPDKAKMVEMEHKFLEVVKSDEMVRKYYKVAASFGIAILNNTIFTGFAYADGLDSVNNKLRETLRPVIELLAGLGYPVTYGMLITGFIMVIMGKKSKGLEIIKWACVGYIGLQFVPFILNILEMIGRDLRSGF